MWSAWEPKDLQRRVSVFVWVGIASHVLQSETENKNGCAIFLTAAQRADKKHNKTYAKVFFAISERVVERQFAENCLYAARTKRSRKQSTAELVQFQPPYRAHRDRSQPCLHQRGREAKTEVRIRVKGRERKELPTYRTHSTYESKWMDRRVVGPLVNRREMNYHRRFR